VNILCNKLSCEFCKKLKEPVVYKPNKNYVPFIDDVSNGSCTLKHPNIVPTIFESVHYEYPQNECDMREGGCGNSECQWNINLICTRDEILIDESLISKDFICKSFSNKKISGHVNWFANLNSDGTAKGGNIDDAYAKRMHDDNKKTKIFQDGRMRQSK
jgi:hypothetical protein